MQIDLINQTLIRAACCVLLVGCFAAQARAQSTDIAVPSPVQANELSGTISPRDLGDARLTDHFYVFTGTPGDLLITIEAQNLNGDVDVFTFSGLRPLLKITVYAENSSPVTKGIYLRTRETLILRVEARTPNDDDGTYRLRFGGSFESITSGPLFIAAENARIQAETSASNLGRSTGRRVTSAGATIAEPAPSPAEVAAVPTPQPSSSETPAEAAKTTTSKTTPGTRRGRRPATRTTRPTAPPKTEGTAKVSGEASPASEEKPVSEAKPSNHKRSPRRGTATRASTKPPVVAEPESGPRLLIETNDGTLIDRYMSSVRRVTVENGQVVVIGKDGKIQRISLASVVRMTISP